MNVTSNAMGTGKISSNSTYCDWEDICWQLLTEYTFDCADSEPSLAKTPVLLALVVDVGQETPGEGQEGENGLSGHLHDHQVHGNLAVLGQDECGVEGRRVYHWLTEDNK